MNSRWYEDKPEVKENKNFCSYCRYVLSQNKSLSLEEQKKLMKIFDVNYENHVKLYDQFWTLLNVIHRRQYHKEDESLVDKFLDIF